MTNFITSGSGSLLRRIAAVPALHQAWRKVRANRGAAGVDAVSILEFEQQLHDNLAELSRNLHNKTYEPLPARQVVVPKANGKMRELAIPTVRDRVAQRAVLDAIEPLFEPQFLDCSFAFRPGRSVEMAIQHIVVARAQGYRWTVDADIENFFPSIDHNLLLAELARRVGDEDILQIIALWLDAGALDGTRPSINWLTRLRSSVAGANLAVRDAVNKLIDDFVSDRLGVAGAAASDGWPDEPANHAQALPELAEGQPPSAASRLTRAAASRLLQDGVLLALTQRAALGSLLTAKALGGIGAILALAIAAPPMIRKVRQMRTHDAGALQGAPISPLLSNVHLHPFDMAMTAKGYRLVRYCDDFVILCRDRAAAGEAMQQATALLKERRLRLNAEKTRLLSPDESFEYLGYGFTADQRVIAPPTTPEVVARRVFDFAATAARQAGQLADDSWQQGDRLLVRLRDKWRNRRREPERQ